MEHHFQQDSVPLRGESTRQPNIVEIPWEATREIGPLPEPIQILLVEDNDDDAELIVHEFQRNGFDPTPFRVETEAAFRGALESQAWDVVISDYSMPTFSGMRALNILRESYPHLPFILISGTIGEEAAVDIMKAGANDYVMKNKLARLIPAVRRELRESRERKVNARNEAKLRKTLAQHKLILGALPMCLYTARSCSAETTWISDNAQRIAGFPAEAFISDPKLWSKRIHPADLERTLEQLCFDGEASSGSAEYRWRCADDTYHWFLDQAMTVQAEDGKAQERLGIWLDITARKKIEDQNKKQIDRLAALRTIDLAITGSMDLRVTMSILLDQIASQLHADAASILLLNPRSQNLEYASSRGFRSNGIRQTRIRLGEGPAGQVAAGRTPLAVRNISDLPHDFRQARGLLEEEFVSYFATPLVAKGQVKGVVEVFHRSRLDPDNEWIDFLETLAGQAAIAIDSATLFDELQRSNMELAISYDATLEGWVRALDLRDKETEGHTQRVTDMTVRLARAMGASDGELVHIRRGALLHDIGKLGIPDNILLKPGTLTPEEWTVMQRHPVYAYEWLSPISYLRPALDIPHCHHEKFDGTGYPRGLKGDMIPMSARIFSVIDVWDALRSDRPYRKGWPAEQVHDYIRANSGQHFDPTVVRVFQDL